MKRKFSLNVSEDDYEIESVYCTSSRISSGKFLRKSLLDLNER